MLKGAGWFRMAALATTTSTTTTISHTNPLGSFSILVSFCLIRYLLFPDQPTFGLGQLSCHERGPVPFVKSPRYAMLMTLSRNPKMSKMSAPAEGSGIAGRLQTTQLLFMSDPNTKRPSPWYPSKSLTLSWQADQQEPHSSPPAAKKFTRSTFLRAGSALFQTSQRSVSSSRHCLRHLLHQWE
jgi:hypothetical protein